MMNTLMLLFPFLVKLFHCFTAVETHCSLFGEEEAQTLGVSTQRLRFLLVFCATLITAASVAISGMIGWVVLIILHVARLLVDPN